MNDGSSDYNPNMDEAAPVEDRLDSWFGIPVDRGRRIAGVIEMPPATIRLLMQIEGLAGETVTGWVRQVGLIADELSKYRTTMMAEVMRQNEALAAHVNKVEARQSRALDALGREHARVSQPYEGDHRKKFAEGVNAARATQAERLGTVLEALLADQPRQSGESIWIDGAGREHPAP